MTTTTAPAFFSAEWAAAARDALQAGPTEELRESKLPTYWEWIDRARAGYGFSWALADLDRPADRRYLLVEWADGQCVRADVVGTEEAVKADYLLAATHAVWQELLGGADAGRALMTRRIELKRGDVLQFFRGVYFVVESLAAIGRVPALLD